MPDHRPVAASRSCCSVMLPHPGAGCSSNADYTATRTAALPPPPAVCPAVGAAIGDRPLSGLGKPFKIASIRGRTRLTAATPTQFNHTDTSRLGDLIAGILCGGRGGFRSCLHSAALYGAVSIPRSDPRTPA